MTTAELLSQLRHRDVKVWANGDRLRYSASPGALTPALRDELAERKAEILKFLQEAAAAAGTCTPPILPGRRDDPPPLSFAQQRLWFLNELEPNTAVYNIPEGFRLRGPLHEPALLAALNGIIERHEILRTVYPESQGQPYQLIRPAQPLQFRSIDLHTLPANQREAEARNLVNDEVVRPFNLASDQMLRALLVKLAPNEHILVLTMHHIASDGWSLGVLRRELSALYQRACRGTQPQLPALAIQYADFAQWQTQQLRGPLLDERLAYWRKQLSGNLQPIELPTDHPRPAVQSYKGKWQRAHFPAELSRQLKVLGLEERATFFMVLLAAYTVLLHRYTEQHDILVGTPSAGRDRAETESLIGFFVNTVVMRTDLSGEPSFREVLRRVRSVAVNAFAHQDLPFEKLAAELKPDRNRSRTPLFQVLFALQSTPANPAELTDLTVEPYEVALQSSKFDLSLFATEFPDGSCELLMEYCTDLFDDSTIERMLAHFTTLLESATSNPDEQIARLTILPAAERQRVVYAWNNNGTPYPKDRCVHELFDEQAAHTPESVALIAAGKSLTYAELNTQANRVAHYLLHSGVKPGEYVGLCADRSFELIVAILGILKAGAAYVPLDPAYPSERLAYMIADARLNIILGQQHLLEKLPPGAKKVCLDHNWAAIQSEPGTTPRVSVDPEHLAYIMYTSGSTGLPKGVMIPHRGIVRLVRNTNFATFGTDEVFLLAAPIAFDASTLEIWGPLLNGGRLAIPAPGLLSLPDLGEALAKFNVTTLWLTAGLFHLMTDTRVDDFKNLRQLLAGGDVLSVPHVRRVLEAAPNCKLINGYGPTESTTFTCCHTLDRHAQYSSVPIGRPISNTQVYILDRQLQPVPIGVPAELYIGGDGLATGYLNKPELTAERFIPNPLPQTPSERLYKTGDRVRYLADGTIEFLGRVDYQVKIRGFRIELDEISAALNLHPYIRESVAVVHEPVPGDKRLVAYYVPRDTAGELTADELKSFLNDRLPAWMVPAHFIPMQSLPLSSNGKVDRHALPPPALHSETTRDATPARSSVEAELIQIWEDLLKTAPIGTRDNFFELGGHSLVAVRMMARVEEVFRKRVPLSDLFKQPTIENLAQAILQRANGESDPPLIQVQGGTQTPFFFLHGDILGGGLYTWNLARHFDPDQPVYALTPQGLDGTVLLPSIEDMTAYHLNAIRQIQPHGPYRLGGTCNGGIVALELARNLRKAGEAVEMLVIIDAWAGNARYKNLHRVVDGLSRLLGVSTERRLNNFLVWRSRYHRAAEFVMLPFSQKARKSARAVSKLMHKRTAAHGECPTMRTAPKAQLTADDRAEVLAQYKRILSAHVPYPYSGHIDLMLSVEEGSSTDDRVDDWKRVARSLTVYEIPGEHATFTSRNLPIVAAHLKNCFSRKEISRDHNSSNYQT